MFPGSIGYQELVVIGIVAVILFGGRLPEVARNLGQSYQQFRKGLADLQSSFTMNETKKRLPDYRNSRSDEYAGEENASDEYEVPTSPRFEPPPAESDGGADSAELEIGEREDNAGNVDLDLVEKPS